MFFAGSVISCSIKLESAFLDFINQQTPSEYLCLFQAILLYLYRIELFFGSSSHQPTSSLASPVHNVNPHQKCRPPWRHRSRGSCRAPKAHPLWKFHSNSSPSRGLPVPRPLARECEIS